MAPRDDDPVEVYPDVVPLTKEEAAHLFQEARKSGDPGEPAKRRLIESHVHLVLPVAERYASRGLSILDLIQEGNLGLMRGIPVPISRTFLLMRLLALRASSLRRQRD